jgi:hypothetical protein
LRQLQQSLDEIKVELSGDKTVTSRNEPAPMSIAKRTDHIYEPSVLSQAPVSAMLKQSYAIAADEFSTVLARLQVLDAELRTLESNLDVKGAPWTPGRIPQWRDA